MKKRKELIPIDKKTIILMICIFIIALLAGYFYADAAEKNLLADENARLVTNLAEEKKSLQKEIEKIRADKKESVNNYYVAAPTVQAAAEQVKKDVREGNPSAKEITSVKGDKTLIAANEEKQRVEVYRVTVDKKRMVGAWAGNKAAGVAIGYDRVILQVGKEHSSGTPVVNAMYVIRF